MLNRFFFAVLATFPLLTHAESIRSMDWISDSKTLIAQTSEKLMIIADGKADSVPGPNNSMRDATLYDHNKRIAVATANGLFVSDLNDISWQPFNDGLDTTDLSFVFTNVELQDVLYTATQSTVYQWTPEDGRWYDMDNGPGGVVTDYLHSNMPDSMDTGWIFASTENGLAFTADCFCFWRDVTEFTQPVLAIAYLPEQPSTYFAMTESGLYTTTDGARSWSLLSEPAFKDATAIVTAGTERLYVGTKTGSIWSFSMKDKTWQQAF